MAHFVLITEEGEAQHESFWRDGLTLALALAVMALLVVPCLVWWAAGRLGAMLSGGLGHPVWR